MDRIFPAQWLQPAPIDIASSDFHVHSPSIRRVFDGALELPYSVSRVVDPTRVAGLASALCSAVEASPEPEVSWVTLPSAVPDGVSAWAPALARACAQALVPASVLVLARVLRLVILPPMVSARMPEAVNWVVPVSEAGRQASVRQAVRTQPKLRARRLPCCHRAGVSV